MDAGTPDRTPDRAADPEYVQHRDRIPGLTALVDTARELAAPNDLDTVLRVLSRRTRLLLGADMAYVSLREGPGSDMVVRASDGHVSALNVGLRVPHDAGLGGVVVAKAAPIWSPDYLADDRFPHSDGVDKVVRAEGLRAILAVPLSHGSDPFGALYLGDRTPRTFTHREIALASSLSELASAAIEKTRLLQAAAADAQRWRQRADRAEAEADELRRIEEDHRRLSDLVLAGGDPVALTSLAHAILDAPLRVLAPDGAVITAAGEYSASHSDADLTAAVAAHHSGEPVVVSDEICAAPIRCGDENLGTVLLNRHGPICPAYRYRLGHVTRALALALTRSGAVTVSTSTLDKFLDELVTSPPPAAEALARRAKRFGIGLDGPHTMLVARLAGPPTRSATTWAPMYARRRGGLAGVRDGYGVLLLPGTDPGAVAQTVSDELSALLGTPVTVGAAGPVEQPAGIPQVYRDAVRCLEAMAALGVSGRGASAGELGFFGLLLSEQHDVAGFVESTIGALVAYDQARFTNLVGTLEGYFAAGQSPTHAAQRLHVHANTVTRRLERIADLLGDRWQDPERALELQLALRLHRLRGLLSPVA
ncbi:helix-turn-helix domain-containing protein [Micromonospora sp. SCSIO 07396]